MLFCIDDTDNLESIGTGKLLENLCESMEKKGWISLTYISRHQLYIHDSIAYTSHNSAMCCQLNILEGQFENVLSYSKEYLLKNSAEGSDPGLCVIKIEDLSIDGQKEIISYGMMAKSVVLKKTDAYNIAEKYPNIIFLSEHGGTGDGVIGALAGCGLRFYGSDGRIKGNFKLKDNSNQITVKEFCKELDISLAVNEGFEVINNQDTLICQSVDKIKKVLWKHLPTVVLEPNGDNKNQWKVINKNDLNRKGIGR